MTVNKCVILASGPSLTIEDIQATKHLFTIAINNTWEKARHCDILYAGDCNWWVHNNEKIDIDAQRYSRSKRADQLFRAKYDGGKGNYNSGQSAIELAVKFGFKEIILLGFDCSLKNGTHHHGDHENMPNPNAKKIEQWLGQFKAIRAHGAKIMNCSRYTELECFERCDLGAVL